MMVKNKSNKLDSFFKSLKAQRSINCRSFQTTAYMQPFGPSCGTPGRNANSGITATVFGGYGFVGRYFLSELGIQIILAFNIL